jgi:hypothetical protein
MTPPAGWRRHLPLLPDGRFSGHIEWLPARILQFFDSMM